MGICINTRSKVVTWSKYSFRELLEVDPRNDNGIEILAIQYDREFGVLSHFNSYMGMCTNTV